MASTPVQPPKRSFLVPPSGRWRVTHAAWSTARSSVPRSKYRRPTYKAGRQAVEGLQDDGVPGAAKVPGPFGLLIESPGTEYVSSVVGRPLCFGQENLAAALTKVKFRQEYPHF